MSQAKGLVTHLPSSYLDSFAYHRSDQVDKQQGIRKLREGNSRNRKGRSCFAGQTIKEAKEALFKKGYEGASYLHLGLRKETSLLSCFEC